MAFNLSGQHKKILLVLAAISGVVVSVEADVDHTIYDMGSFLKIYNSDNPTQEIVYVKKYFASPDTTLNRLEYLSFLRNFLELQVDDLPDDEELQEEARSFHKESSESYIMLHKEKDQQVFTLADAMKDIGIGNLMVHVGAGGVKYSDFSDEVDLEDEEDRNGVDGSL